MEMSELSSALTSSSLASMVSIMAFMACMSSERCETPAAVSAMNLWSDVVPKESATPRSALAVAVVAAG